VDDEAVVEEEGDGEDLFGEDILECVVFSCMLPAHLIIVLIF
jgi:hypothetical protein